MPDVRVRARVGGRDVAMTITIFVSWLSYRYLESWFLKIKHKFTVVKSGSFIEE